MRFDPSAAWIAYKHYGDMDARHDLIVHYHAKLVRPLAMKVGSRLPALVDRQDLVSYGTFGLIDAIEKFDLDKGVKFETYATNRIRGAIFDELRTLDWVPRGVRAQIKGLERTYEGLSVELGRTPGDPELASRMGMTVAELGQVSATALTSLEPPDGQPAISVPDDSNRPEETAMVSDLMDRIAVAVSSLGDRARSIIAMYYLEQLTMSDIGQVLGVTESRVCQLHGGALRDLREAILAA